MYIYIYMYIGYHHNGLRWKVRYVVHDDGRTSDKIWTLVSPRCQEVIFPGSSNLQTFQDQARTDNSEKEPSSEQTFQTSVKIDGQRLIQTFCQIRMTVCSHTLSYFLCSIKTLSLILQRKIESVCKILENLYSFIFPVKIRRYSDQGCICIGSNIINQKFRIRMGSSRRKEIII